MGTVSRCFLGLRNNHTGYCCQKRVFGLLKEIMERSSVLTSVFLENGVVIMLEACFFFAIFDTMAKYFVQSFTMGEVAFVRFGFGALMMAPSLLRNWSGIAKKDYFWLVLRGLMGAMAFYLYFLALQTGTLSMTMVLFFTSPFWALLMGALFLRERLTRQRILCVITAMVGTTILIHPQGGISISYVFGLACGVMGGMNAVLTRHLRARHSSGVIYGFQCMVGTLFSLFFIVGTTHLPPWADGSLLLVAAIFGLLGQVAMNHGLRFIRAAEGSTLMMTEVILTTMTGILLFEEPFTFTFVVGTLTILGSGIYLGLKTGNETIGIDRE